MTDSYKLTHWKQYPKGTTKVYSYLESRGGKFHSTVFFGAQYLIKKYMTNPITQKNIDEAEDFCNAHFYTKNVFNRNGWEYILNTHGGYLPIEIRAVAEGTVVPTGNVLMTIENTDPECFWLTNVMETLLMKVWSPITIATNSYFSKKIITESAIKTGSDTGNVDFKLHDFGYRGVSSEESAGILGAAHLLNFKGTDTIAAIQLIREYYNWNEDGLPGYSVVASEHSTATPFGKGGEREYVLNMLNQYPDGIISVVSDSYNIYDFCKMISTDSEIKEKILSRDGCFVVRPDSGEPVEVVSKVMDILWNNFGGSFTDKHYKLLNSHIRVIQGDGIDIDMIKSILQMLENSQYASDNIVFGSGGGLLQKFDRDTQKFAIKCSLAIINGQEVNVQKDPFTSAGKKSKQGYLKLLSSNGGSFLTVSSAKLSHAQFHGYIDNLRTIYKNGELIIDDTFTHIRNRIK